MKIWPTIWPRPSPLRPARKDITETPNVTDEPTEEQPSDAHAYVAVTSGIRVSVEPTFLDEQSAPDEDTYVWTYKVVIHNEGDQTVELRTRVWRITDAFGQTVEVRGPGVVGQFPVLAPGDTFTYSSGCPLKTPQGIMVGSYQMSDESGKMIDIAIPAFSLDSPYAARSLN